MPGAYSTDLRERVLVAVEAGEPADVVADEFMVGRSSVYRWVTVARDEGRRVAKPMNAATDWRRRPACGSIPGQLAARCAGWTGRERNAASSLLSRTVTTSCRRARPGRRMRPPGLVGSHRNGWWWSAKARC